MSVSMDSTRGTSYSVLLVAMAFMVFGTITAVTMLGPLLEVLPHRL